MAGFQDDQGAGTLAPFFVGHADDRHFAHRWVLESSFRVQGRYPLAPRLDPASFRRSVIDLRAASAVQRSDNKSVCG